MELICVTSTLEQGQYRTEDPDPSERNCGTQLLLSNAVRMRVAGECTGQQGTGHGPISQLSSRSGSRD